MDRFPTRVQFSAVLRGRRLALFLQGGALIVMEAIWSYFLPRLIGYSTISLNIILISGLIFWNSEYTFDEGHDLEGPLDSKILGVGVEWKALELAQGKGQSGIVPPNRNHVRRCKLPWWSQSSKYLHACVWLNSGATATLFAVESFYRRELFLSSRSSSYLTHRDPSVGTPGSEKAPFSSFSMDMRSRIYLFLWPYLGISTSVPSPITIYKRRGDRFE